MTTLTPSPPPLAGRTSYAPKTWSGKLPTRAPARAKTSSEFIRDLKVLSDIPEEHLDKLPPLARLADGVKFAGFIPDNEDAPRSHDLVRAFVVDTTPKPDPESEDA